MLEDRLLIWRFRRGSSDALRRIYEKYADPLRALAAGLCGNISDGEDIVHDVFVTFAGSANRLGSTGSLKSYLAACVTNRVRDGFRKQQRHPIRSLVEAEGIGSKVDRPDFSVIRNEEMRHLGDALAGLPYEQREVIMLHLHGGMKFRQIAELQRISINTVQGRYRYGLDKLRSLMNGEIQT